MWIRSFFVACIATLSLFNGSSLIAANNQKDIVSTAVEAGSFRTLAAALNAGGLVETLQGKGPFTVFAPSDEAFAKLPEGTVAKLLEPENKEQLIALLTYHVVPGKVLVADVVKLTGANTVNGQRVNIKVDGEKVLLDQAQVIATDIACTNGVIHVIDRVLLPASETIPEALEKEGNFKALLATAQAVGLVDTLAGDKPFTVFAPTDEAFAKLPAGTVETLLKAENQEKLAEILKYHVIPGRVYASQVLEQANLQTVQGGLLTPSVNKGHAKINGAGIVATDIDALNGVIHVIDRVLIPAVASPNKGVRHAQENAHYVSTVCPVTGKRTTYRILTSHGR